MENLGWNPTFIDIESEFSTFVPTFRDRMLVRDLIPDQPVMALNADFYFPESQVVVELKTMQTDSRNGYPERLVKAYTHFGYTGSVLTGFCSGANPYPSELRRVFGARSPIPCGKLCERPTNK